MTWYYLSVFSRKILQSSTFLKLMLFAVKVFVSSSLLYCFFRLFEREVRKACALQETLGMGIGLFQGKFHQSSLLCFSSCYTNCLPFIHSRCDQLFPERDCSFCPVRWIYSNKYGLVYLINHNNAVLSVWEDTKRIIGQMTPGELMSFLVTAQTIQRSLSQLSIVFGNAVKGWTAGARVFQVVFECIVLFIRGQI